MNFHDRPKHHGCTVHIAAWLLLWHVGGCNQNHLPDGTVQPTTTNLVAGNQAAPRGPDSDLTLSAADAVTHKIRIATFNLALNRPTAGQLVKELADGNCQPAKQLAEIIQRVRPDILLLNEVDYDAAQQSAISLHDLYLARSQNGQIAINYPYRFTAPVNTGEPSGIDLDQNGRINDPTDAFGFGRFPGQYGMVVFSRFPIDQDAIRTFQKFLWKDMPDARLPHVGARPYYDEATLDIFRLSSKSYWDVPINVQDTTIHFLVSHPTPPVFDGKEDRNGTRNHDEIRLIADYLSPTRSEYIYDDRGHRGGLRAGSHFVIAGDLNADPNDGDSTGNPIRMLIDHDLVNSSTIPASQGAIEASAAAKVNQSHQGDAAHDTGSFGKIGNYRIDYVLPSKSLEIVASGVFWPASDEEGHKLVAASDHRLVWIDVTIPNP